MLRWLPWRLVATRLARAHGFLDPISFLGQLRRFAKASEVAEPLELVRAGVLFHARGLINTKAIQFNLDWVWPYWVERQFNPADPAFIPRAFSFSHINLTHRNWTAVGLPDVPFYAVVDPRGLVTPLFDGWSLDFWVLPEGEEPLIPSKLAEVEQTYLLPDRHALSTTLGIRTVARKGEIKLTSEVSMIVENNHPRCFVEVRLEGVGARQGWLAVALRPYNPEGISYIRRIETRSDKPGWIVDEKHYVALGRPPVGWQASSYAQGDVFHHLNSRKGIVTTAHCDVGMASAAALYRIQEVAEFPLTLSVPIYDELHPKQRPEVGTVVSWSSAQAGLATLRVPDSKLQFLYDAAVSSLVLHAPGEVYPGPYTYKRFWFRDAAFILNALLVLGAVDRVGRALKLFPKRQTRAGYFLSQEGEWDSNGEALWILHRYHVLTQRALEPEWIDPVRRGAQWIGKKRLPEDNSNGAPGLLPAGFSAEHLGPNDFYFWDDFWGVAGLRSASALLTPHDPKAAEDFTREADNFWQTIMATLERVPGAGPENPLPASPHRRMDSGAIGNIVADYPLQLLPAAEPRMLATVDWLLRHSAYDGAFFQNMIHSGINAYLTLELAQVLLRAGQVERAWQLVNKIAELASPTGQWPEAIHPKTGGGCMGDGHHIWASAEWVLWIRAIFIREEGNRLVLVSGLPAKWLAQSAPLQFGPTLTPFGEVALTVTPDATGGSATLALKAKWHDHAPALEIRLPGFAPVDLAPRSATTTFQLLRL